VVDDDDVVGQRLGLLHEVRGQQHRDAVGAQRAHELPHQAPALRVEARGGLVEEHELGPPDHRARQREALLLADREALEGRAGAGREAQGLDEPVGVEGVRGTGRDQPEHLAHPDPGVGAAALRHDAEAGAQRVGRAGGVDAEHPHLARVAAAQPLAHLDGRGLAGAVGSEEREHPARGEVEVEPVDRGAALVAHDEVAHLHRGTRHVRQPRSPGCAAPGRARRPAAPGRAARPR
jgi:hypothetical protein